jgi:hypothetical protein
MEREKTGFWYCIEKAHPFSKLKYTKNSDKQNIFQEK